uniref:Cadherin 19 n=1 Tax=Latimeria chalumnae TaxID=7897 RepID=H3A7Y8_LATCH
RKKNMNCYALMSVVIGMAMIAHCLSSPARPKCNLQRKKHSIPEKHIVSHRRVKRGWVWNQLFVLEEQIGTEPVYVGQIKSDSNMKNGSLQYILSGEGAGTIFTIDESTGIIHALKKLDREAKPIYALRAQAVNKFTHQPVESESEFAIKVQDVNDNEPQFSHKHYTASIPEMSHVGTSVIQVTATDADDPSYGNNAKLVYSILQGQPYFSVEPKTGIIRIALPNMDREAKDHYQVIIQAKDMVGQMGGLSGTATVLISLSDVNDNGPKFQHKLYYFSVPESAPIGTIIGKVVAEDKDLEENAAMNYTIEETDGSNMFDIITEKKTQKGIIVLRKLLDYESKRLHSIKVEVINKYIDSQFQSMGPLKDITNIKISVKDVDEPPVFTTHNYSMEVLENAETSTSVGTVTARDPDSSNNPIRYSIDPDSDLNRMFSIDANSGVIYIAKPLDREVASWHNLSVTAAETKDLALASNASVHIRVVDINDHMPEFPVQYNPYVCENAKSKPNSNRPVKQLKQDRRLDTHSGIVSLESLFPQAQVSPHFKIKFNSDNTANVFTRRSGFSYQEEPIFYLPILIMDNGNPALSSTNTLTVRVCKCDPYGIANSCNAPAFALPFGLDTETLIAILACLLILLVLVLLVLVLQRQKRKPFVEKGEEVRENIVKYDDEGGGEEDTEAFDIAALTSHTIMRKHKPRRNVTLEVQSLCRQSLGIGPDNEIFRKFIQEKLEEADTDPDALPYDSLQTYAFEGNGSVAGSLISSESVSSDLDQNYDYLSDWGPHFRKLADMYGNNDNEVS